MTEESEKLPGRGGRRAALATVILALGVVGALGYALRGQLVERWLVHQLRSGDHFERCSAARQLATLLGSHDPETRAAAAYALGEIRPAAGSAAAKLEALLELETQERLREPIQEALARVRGAPP